MENFRFSRQNSVFKIFDPLSGMENILLDSRQAVQRFLAENGHITPQEQLLILSFQGRYKLAHNFRGIVVEGYKDRTLISYNLGFQMFLTYTALERLCKVTRDKHYKVELNNPATAQRLRTVYVGQQNAMRAVLLKTQFLKGFEDFMAGKTDNVRIMATTLRMLVSAGHFSFSSTSTLMPLHIRALQELNKAILDFCSSRFRQWESDRRMGEEMDEELPATRTAARDDDDDDEDDYMNNGATPTLIASPDDDEDGANPDFTETSIRRRYSFGF